jgi:hypothetical protein
MSVDFHRTARGYVLEDRTLRWGSGAGFTNYRVKGNMLDIGEMGRRRQGSFQGESRHSSRGTEDVPRKLARNMADMRSDVSDMQKSAEK